MKLFLGIDGGGTRTRAVLVDENGRFQGCGLAGPSNYDDIGIAAAQNNIKTAVTAAFHRTNTPVQTCAAVFLGLAGIVSDDDRAIIRTIASNLTLAPSEFVGVDHDIRIALAGGLSGRPGIALIAGTGSACYGRNAAGRSWRAGGWGQLIGDEGSSYWLGVQAMRAAVFAFDGRGPQTELESVILNHLHLPDLNDIMHHLYNVGMSRSEIASLAPLVVSTAEAGDEVANALLDQAAHDLAVSVTAVAAKLNLQEQSELVLIGGLLTNTTAVRHRLQKELSKRLPSCHLTQSELPPVLGACLLALISQDPDLNTVIKENLKTAVIYLDHI